VRRGIGEEYDYLFKVVLIGDISMAHGRVRVRVSLQMISERDDERRTMLDQEKRKMILIEE
jgi:hypothetical protein